MQKVKCEADLSMTNGVELIRQERERHFIVEGWTADHDLEHERGELAIAAACYAVEHTDASVLYPDDHPDGSGWPWGEQWWKPKTTIHNLARAGALIAAEIDREISVQYSNGTLPSPATGSVAAPCLGCGLLYKHSVTCKFGDGTYNKSEVLDSQRVESVAALVDEVSAALNQMRDMFPDAVRVYISSDADYFDGTQTIGAFILIDHNVFRGVALSEAMQRVREWKNQEAGKSNE